MTSKMILLGNNYAYYSQLSGINRYRFLFAGIVVGSVIGGVLIILLAAILVCAVVYRRKKSRVTLTFDMNTIKATQ